MLYSLLRLSCRKNISGQAAVTSQDSYLTRCSFILQASMGVLVLFFFHQPHEVNMEVPGKGKYWPRG